MARAPQSRHRGTRAGPTDAELAELQGRAAEARAELERLGVDAKAVEHLIIPTLRFAASGAGFDLPEPIERALEAHLGKRYFSLDERIGPPSAEELHTEMKRLARTVPREHRPATAHATIFQRRLKEQRRDPARERERPTWEAAGVLGVAVAGLSHTTRTVLAGARAYFEALDRAHPVGESWSERQAERRQEIRRRGAAGGKGGAGKPKRPHTELIRRAVAALVEKNLEVSADNVRLLLKSGWDKLARDWGDPLRDIVDVQIREKRPVVIEYTAKWALAHHDKRHVEIDADALDRAIKRAPKNK